MQKWANSKLKLSKNTLMNFLTHTIKWTSISLIVGVLSLMLRDAYGALSYDTYTSSHAVSVSPPACSVTVGTVAALKTAINNHSDTVVCVEAGNYDLSGSFNVTDSGTEGTPRWLRFYAGSDDGKAPWDQASAARLIGGLDFTGRSWWNIHRIEFDGNSQSTVVLDFGANTEDILLDTVWVHTSKDRLLKMNNGARRIQLQNSVVNEAIASSSKEGHCISINADNGDARDGGWHKLINNEVYNCQGDGMQAYSGDATSATKHVPGVIIDNNDFYIEHDNLDFPMLHNAAGNWNTTGPYSCSENALDIKISAQPTDDKWEVTHNRFWGFRGTSKTGDPKPSTCSELGDHGSAVIAHYQSDQNILFQHNIIWNSGNGVAFNTNNVDVLDNIFYNVSNSSVTLRNRGMLNVMSGSSTYYGNILHTADWYYRFESTRSNVDIINNVIFDGGTFSNEAPSGKGWSIGHGMYFDTGTKYGTGDNAYTGGNQSWALTSEAKANEFCFLWKRQTGATLACIPDVLATTSSPYPDYFDTDVSWTFDQTWLNDPAASGMPKFPGQVAAPNGYYARYEKNIGVVPSCAAPTGRYFSTSDSLSFIEQRLNDPTSGEKYFCFNPGDYTSKGHITLTSGGSTSDPKWIRLAGLGTEPPVQLPNTPSDRATLAGLAIQDGDWVIHRMAFDGSSDQDDDQIKIEHASNTVSNVTFSKILAEECYATDGDESRACIEMKRTNGVTVQNSVVRRTEMVPQTDAHCIATGGTNVDVRIVNNEIYDCAGDGFMTNNGSDLEGARIENNDFYTTTYLDGPTGKICGENGLDFKGPTDNEADYTYILANRFWRFRDTATSCGGGSGASGEAIIINNDRFDANPPRPGEVRFYRIEANIFEDSIRFISTPQGAPQQVSILTNVMYNANDPTGGENSYAISMNKGGDYIIRWNTIIDSSQYYVRTGGNDWEFDCNTVIGGTPNTDSIGMSSTADRNSFFSASPLVSIPRLSVTNTQCPGCSTNDANMTSLVYQRKLWTGIENSTIPNGRMSETSPQYNLAGCI